jgi:hypothetical protein
MAFIYDLSDTWNAGATTFTAIKMNVTDTASAAGSKLIDLQVGGTTRFDVDKNGQVEISAGTALLPSLSTLSDTNTGMWFPAADTVAWSTGGSERVRIISSGRVGIGTSSPGALLDVNGDIIVAGSSIGSGNVSSNIKLASIATYGLNTTGNNNVAIGASTLLQNTTGDFNVAVGANALQINTTGDGNMAAGLQALTLNTTGNNNVGVGRQTLASNTTGAENTAIGTFALLSNTTSSFSVAIGSQSLFNSTGASNTGLGAYSFRDITTGVNNTAVGFNTGRGITTGSSNTIIGANVSGLSATLANNIIIADGAGNRRINVDGSGNVGIGTTAPDALLSVNGISSFGAGAAATPSIAGFGDLNTGMWFPAADTIAWSTGGSERMRIDSSGNVGIGTNAPTYRLDVQSSSDSFFRVKTTGTASAWFIGEAGAAGAVYYHNPSNTPSIITTNGSERVRITATGNVGIGTASPDALLSVNGIASFGAGAAATPSIAAFGDLNTGMWFPAADTVAWSTSGSERMRITSGGNLGLGTSTFGTSAAVTLAIATGTAPTTGPADTIQIYSTDLTAGNTMLSLYTEGTIVNTNTTAATTHRIAIRVNGTVYYLLANTAA